MAVFRPVDILRLRTQNGDVVRRKAQRQVVRDLSAHRNHHAVRCFQFDDIHHPFKGEFIEIQAVAHVVVGGNRFGVIVDEHAPPSPLAQGIQAGYGAPVEFYRTADAVGTGSQHNNRTAIFLIINIIDRAIVSKIQVIGLGRELGGKGINLLDDRQDAQLFSAGTDLVHIVVRIAAVLADRTLDLEIGETLLLGQTEEVFVQVLDPVHLAHFLVGGHNPGQFIQEPAVDLRKLMDAIDRISGTHRLGNDEDTIIGRFQERLVHIGDDQLFVAHETVRTLADHPQALLDGLFEGAAHSHHLTHALHAGADLVRYPLEFGQIPTRNLAHDVIQGRFKEGRSGLGHGILQVKETVAQAQFRCHKGQRITGRLRCQGRRTAQTGIHLDDAVVHGIGIVGVLHVALAHNADMTHNLDGQFPQEIVVFVAERLRRSHDDALSGMDPERVEILHVADRNAVVVFIANNFIFNFFPAFQRLLHQHLGREGEGFLADLFQFLVVVHETRTQATQGVSGAHNQRIAQFLGGSPGGFDALGRLGLDGFHLNLVQFLDKEIPVFRVHDGLYRGTQYLHIVLIQRSRLVQLHATVQGRLATETQQDALRALPFNNPFHEEGRHRKEVDLVGHSLAGLYRGDVRIDENRLDPLFLQRLEGLRTGIVEFTGLANLQRSRSQEQYFFDGRIFHILKLGDEVIKQELGIGRAAGGLGMELHRTEGFGFVTDALIGAVVHVHEPGLPIATEGFVIHRVTMVLRGNEAAIGIGHADRLVMAAVAVFQFKGTGTRRTGQQLISHADAENGFFLGHGTAQVFYGDAAESRVTGAVGNKEAVVLDAVEIEVPGYPDQFHTPFYKAAEDVVLDPAIYHDHPFVAAAVGNGLLAANVGNLVLQVGIVHREVLVLPFLDDHSQHRTIFAENLGERARIDPVNTGDLLLLQPLVQAFHRIPVTVAERVVADNQTAHPDVFRFEIPGDSHLVRSFKRNPVITNQRVGYA